MSDLRSLRAGGEASPLDSFGPWDSLLGALQDTTNAPAALIEALRTAHVELEMQSDELRRSQRRMSQTLSTFRALFDLLPVPLWLVGPNGMVTHGNGAAAVRFPRLTSGGQFAEAMPFQSDRAQLIRVLDALAREPQALLPAIGLLPKIGHEVRRGDLYVKRVHDDQGEPSNVVAFVDLTDEIGKQLALEAALTREHDASMAKSNFLSGVSHELRTPLNAVVGFSQLLQAHFGGSRRVDDDTGLHWTNTLSNAAQHLTTLVTDLLDLQALELGRLNVQFTPVDLARIAEESAAMVLHRFNRSGVALREQTVTGNRRVSGDPARCKQVIINLLDNAAKYTPRGRSVAVSLRGMDAGVRLEVADEGPGLNGEQQAQLFEAFNRLGAERSGIEGLGMGLAICKHLVTRMGGRIGCESAVGKGARFWFWLPESPAP